MMMSLYTGCVIVVPVMFDSGRLPQIDLMGEPAAHGYSPLSLQPSRFVVHSALHDTPPGDTSLFPGRTGKDIPPRRAAVN